MPASGVGYVQRTVAPQVVPHRVDELRLGGKQRRTRYTLERDEHGHASAGALAPLGTSWQVQDVNP